jgi:ankyrin repeat protein
VYGRTKLWHLASQGDVDGVKSEVKCGADPSLGDDAGYTPLHIAVQERHPEIIGLLLQLDADPNKTDTHGNGPLWTAVYWGYRADRTDANLEIIKMLLQGGADPNHENAAGRTPRQFAMEAGDEPLQSLFGKPKASRPRTKRCT